MHLYSLTLLNSTSTSCAIHGYFTQSKVEEICLIKGSGKRLEILKPDSTGRLQTIVSSEAFGLIRSIAPFRLQGQVMDFIVVASDSGCLVVLKVNMTTSLFERVHCEVFGKTGCRRIVPGQYLASDPTGRAIMIGATEKQRLVYVLNRDADENLTISSPLEASKNNSILYSLVGLDVGFENPIFAALEVRYTPPEEELEAFADSSSNASLIRHEKELVLYELDLGINSVVRKSSQVVHDRSNMLIPLPSGINTSGVLVCAENLISYRSINGRILNVAIPRRFDTPDDRGIFIVNYVIHPRSSSANFLILLQSEYGDLYKVTLQHQSTSGANPEISDVCLEYFDTVPVCSAMTMTKNGLLFVGSEAGNQYLYHLLPENDNDSATSSLKSEILSKASLTKISSDGHQIESKVMKFKPKKLQHLEKVDELPSLSPCVGSKVLNLANEETNQIYALSGKDSRSSLKTVRQGLEVTEVAVTELPGNPSGIWTLRAPNNYDQFILLSFLNATLALSVGASVSQASDVAFDKSSQTLIAGVLSDHSLVQVTSNGYRRIDSTGKTLIKEWRTHGKIEHAAMNSRQIVVSIPGGVVIHFQLDSSGTLSESARTDLGIDVCSLELGQVPEGRLRCSYVAVGCHDKRVLMLSLDPNSPMSIISTQVLSSKAESLCLTKFGKQQFLCVGLEDGIFTRTHVEDESNISSGSFMESSGSHFLGLKSVRAVKLPLKVDGEDSSPQEVVIAMSNRSYLCYVYQGNVVISPISYRGLEHAAKFTTEECPEGIVAISGNTLRIITLDRFGTPFNFQQQSLLHTPRRVLPHPNSSLGILMVLEGDHNALRKAELEKRIPLYGNDLYVKKETSNKQMEQDNDDNDDDDDDDQKMTFSQIGYPKPNSKGCWVSSLSLVRTKTKNQSLIQSLEFEVDELGVSLETCRFGQDMYLVIGTVLSLSLHPRAHKGGRIRTYKFIADGLLEMIHITSIPDDIPLALCEFQGRLLVGAGSSVKLFALGKNKLLVKSEFRTPQKSSIGFIKCNNDRIFVGDSMDSIIVLKHIKQNDTFLVIAMDTLPRMIVSGVVVDYDTIIASDKFGSVFTLRVPPEANDEDQLVLTNRTVSLWDQSTNTLGSSIPKLEMICNFYAGDMITSLEKASLVRNGTEVIVCTSVTGAISALAPFIAKDDLDFMIHLELLMRQHISTLSGWDHLRFRSYFSPVKGVIDGDLIEMFTKLPNEKQQAIASLLNGREIPDVIKRIEAMRTSIML